MTEDDLRRLLHRVSGEGGASLARVGKQMRTSRSQLHRLLTVVGNSEGFGDALGFVELLECDPPRLTITEKGKTWLQENP